MNNIDFKKGDGLVPVIIQDSVTDKVLMLGYMNEESYKKTIETKKVTFYSRSRQKLWVKGETSGNFLNLVEVKLDCDNDSLLIKVEPVGPACHTGDDTCWGEKNVASYGFLSRLESVIEDRYNNPDEKSYTCHLFKKGINKIAQKVGEEAVETIIEAKDNNDDLFKNEVADLMYQLMVLIKDKKITYSEIMEVLEQRHS